MPFSLYVHIPFCLQRCIYCDFVSGIHDPEKETVYTRALKREISGIPHHDPMTSLYIGGGTPTVLSTEVLCDLVCHITSHTEFADHYEATIEANPGTVDRDKLHAVRSSGINRVSFGVQSFHDDELSFLGRIHSSEDAERAILLAGECGFENVGVDLLYGIPGQEMCRWRKTLEKVVGLRPHHISTYELTVEEGTTLQDYLTYMNGRVFCSGSPESAVVRRTVDEDSIVEMYEYAIDFLASEGYIQYEISNFSLPGYACQHNIQYWSAGHYYGVGLGAHSHVPGRRFYNIDSLEEYVHALTEGTSPVQGEEKVTREKAISEALFLGLRMTEGVDLKTFLAKYSCDPLASFRKEIAELQEDSLIEVGDRGNRMRLTRRGLCLSNSVFVKFI